MTSHSNAQPGLFDTIHDFVVAGISNDLTEADWIAFERLLRENDDACRLYVEYVEQSDILQALMDAVPGGAASSPDAFFLDGQESPLSVPVIFTTPSPAASGHYLSGWPAAYLVATVVFGIALVIGAFTHISRPVDFVHQAARSRSASSTQPTVVGQITGMVDCECEGAGFRVQGSGDANHPSKIINHRSAIHLGDRLTLRSGLLELTYNTGARVVLQGPVSYYVESAAGGFLSVGKLTARLEKRPESANQKSEIVNRQFAIRTPTAIVTDLGTEFGIEVNKEGDTTSHVFRGTVELQTLGADGHATAESRILRADESARVTRASDGRTSVQAIAVDPATFVRPAAIPKPVDDTRSTPFHRWQGSSERLRRDPSLLAYYDFQRQPDCPSVLPNVAANGDKSLDGAVENATWTAGRMPGKDAMQFNGPSDFVRVDLSRRTDDVTLAAWICLYSLDNAYNGVLMSDGWGKEGLIHWQITDNGGVQYGLRGTKPVDVPVFGAGRFQRWTHLVMTYKRASGEIRMYVNGRLAGELDFPERTAVCIGPARIGHWNSIPFEPSQAPRNFHGRIDELAVFKRPLGVEEVIRMYQEGRPANDRGAARSSR